MATAPISDITDPAGPIIPTFPPPPISLPFTSTGTPSSRSALPGSILSISHSTSGETSTLTESETTFTPTPTTTTDTLTDTLTPTPTDTPTDTLTPTPTDSQPTSSGTLTTDTSSASATPAPSSISSTFSMTSPQPSSAASLPSSSSPSSSPTVIVPIAAASTHSHAGAIAGGVIGGLAFVVLAVGLLFFLRRRSRQRNQNETLPWGNGGLGRRRGEVRISSSSGLAGAGAGDRASGYGFARRMSGVGFGMGVADSDPKPMYGDLPRHSTTSNATSHDEYGAGYSDDEEKNSTLQNHDAYSAHNKSFDLADTGIPHLPMEPPSAFPLAANDRQRAREVMGQNRAVALAQLDGAAISRSPSGASTLDPFTSPSDHRRYSGGAHRRPTQRKAVPKYDKAEFSMTELSSPTSHSASSHSAHEVSISEQNLPRTGSVEAMRPSSGAHMHTPLPALNHKTSFGDMRPVHYLIPDLPPPQKE